MIRLFHVSDVHFGAEDRTALDWFAGAVAAESPDAIIMTGDLTMRARHREFEAAAAWLKSLNKPVTVEVGNHDLPYFNLAARFVTAYKRYRALEAMIEKPIDLPGVTIAPLKTTARFQWRFNWSKGYVSSHALEQALGLVEAAPDGNLVFVTCHHPLVEADTHMSSRTRGGREALAALASAGAHAVLTGHVHDPFDLARDVAGREVRLIGAGTLSERVRARPPSFNEIRIADGRFETVARFLGEAPPAVERQAAPGDVTDAGRETQVTL